MVTNQLGRSRAASGMLFKWESDCDYLGETGASEVKVQPIISNCLLRRPAGKPTAQVYILALLGQFQALYSR